METELELDRETVTLNRIVDIHLYKAFSCYERVIKPKTIKVMRSLHFFAIFLLFETCFAKQENGGHKLENQQPLRDRDGKCIF